MKRYYLTNTKALENTLKEHGLELVGIPEQEGRQIDNCQAWEIEARVMDIATTKFYKMAVLQSYNTAVAVRGLTGVVVRCGYWSRTTSQQTTRWERGH